MAERDHWSGYSQEDTFDDERRERGLARYELRRSPQADDDYRSPAFLSPDYDEQEPIEDFTPLRKRRSSISLRILMASCAAAAVAVLLALVSSDAMRDIVDIKASVAGVLSTPPVAAQSKTAQTNPEPVSKNPDRWSAHPGGTSGVPNITVANAAPAREETKNIDQAPPLPRASIVARTEPTELPAEALHRLASDEIAAALKRADALIASGDVAAARLVLRRAAEDGDPKAALLLAGTYDPAVLARLGVHGIAPDAAAARGWYEKARTFGSTEAAQRLQALASKRN
jgi:hypothetical protein